MRLKEIRLENNLMQEDIAKILNVKRNTYSMWELEHDKMPLKKLITFSEYFNISLDYILEFSNIKKYNNSTSFNREKYLIRLKEVRKENKKTQAKLAELLSTTNSVISRYEHGGTFILTIFLIEYCKMFKVSADYLLGKIDTPKYIIIKKRIK